jgi:hypothetical protein
MRTGNIFMDVKLFFINRGSRTIPSKDGDHWLPAVPLPRDDSIEVLFTYNK